MRIFLLLLLIPVAACCHAQKVQKTEPKVRIGFSPLALAQIDFTLLPTAEIQLSDRLILNGEAGYIFSSLYLNEKSYNAAQGFIARVSPKIFTGHTRRFYLAPQFFYKKVSHRIEDWLGKDVVGGVPSYSQYQRFRYERRIYGTNLTCGVYLPLDRKGRNSLDLYAGLGVRWKKAEVTDVPRAAYRTNIQFFGDEGLTTASTPIGARLLFALH